MYRSSNITVIILVVGLTFSSLTRATEFEFEDITKT